MKSLPTTVYGTASEAPFQEILGGIVNLGQLVARAAELWPNKIAWHFDTTGEQFTFAQVHHLSGSLASRLKDAGVCSGSKVAVLAANTPEFPLAWLALARLGATMVPVNVSYRLADAGHVLGHSAATLLVASGAFTNLANQLVNGSEGQLTLFCLDAGSLSTGPADMDELDRSSVDSITNVQYTSGTTGLPKGCMLSNEYWLSLAASLIAETPKLDHHDVLVTAQPFHYIDPQWNVAVALLIGARLVIVDRFHPSTFWDCIRRHEVTYFYCLGLMPTLLLKMPASELDRQHCVRAISCSAIPAHLHRELESRWGVPWYESFGMTETGADLGVNAEEHDQLLGTGCLGRPRKHRQAAIVDQEGHSVDPGTTGQLLLRGHGLFSGYSENREATDTAMNQGWFATGDLARADVEGRIYYQGRTKDMIRRSGENIAAAEVEAVLQRHPLVRLAAVVPVTDELRGEEILAFLVAQDSHIPTAEVIAEAARFCRQELAYFKTPRYWRVAGQLPLTPSERVAKQKLLLDDPLQGAWDSKTEEWLGTEKELA